MNISIPTPCHQDWNKMSPNTNGRYCGSCCKTVIDFSNMSDAEVKFFLLNKKEEHICGRFLGTQLQRIKIELPQNILYYQMPAWKRFLLACLIVFSTTLFSCEVKHTDSHLTGLLIMPQDSLVQKADSIPLPDTALLITKPFDTITPNYFVGEIAPIRDSVIEVIPYPNPQIPQPNAIPTKSEIVRKIICIPDSIEIPKHQPGDSTTCNNFQ